MKVLLVDHEDSFVYNLAQAFGRRGAEVGVFRYTAPPAEVDRFGGDAIVLSPGPGSPSDRRVTGLARRLLRERAETTPVLGVCLGHQLIAEVAGGRVARGPRPVHGEAVDVDHDGGFPFCGVPSPFRAARYHSLRVLADGLPPTLEVSARDRAGVVMAVRDRRRPTVGLQFHPESFLTPHGDRILGNFLAEARR